ncbi:MAG: hypothetical protein QOF51_2536 [Chloroflexota bacterium]|nr:hypothetical protein [Chloroflexota bacterium]
MRFEATRRFGVAPEALWPLVSNTVLMNRVIGLQDVEFAYAARADGGSVVTGEFRRFGRTFARWTEHAFDFVRPQRYRVLREYSLGPLASLDGGVELIPEDGGQATQVRVFADILPRNPLGWILAKRLVGPSSTSRVLAQCQIFEEYLNGKVTSPFPQLAPRGGVDARRLDELTARLIGSGAERVVVERLRAHLAEAPEEQTASMRPFELADAWGVSRETTLIGFLRATTVGLLDLKWDVLCPNCRIPKAEYSTLADLELRAHCETCNITFDANFDRLVEVRFKVSSAVRATSVGVFCVGGPQNIPHVVAQAELEPGAALTWQVPLTGTAFRLRSPQSRGAAILEVDAGGPDQAEFAVESAGIAPPLAQVDGAAVAMRIVNRLDTPAIVALEERFWSDTAATAAIVSSLQEFRDLFSAEVLAPGLQVGIERLALLFTDLAGSTELYERIGQARAFRLVQDHFRLLDASIRGNGGAQIKTIGDAVMAAFPTVPLALRAAADMQRRILELQVAEVDPTRLLKVGIHAGACLAVNLDGRLDYFGTAVNIAARVESEAHGGEIVISDDARWDPGVEETLARERLDAESQEVRLKGIARVVRVHRIARVPPAVELGAQSDAASASAAPTV